jgi:LysM repeat protein
VVLGDVLNSGGFSECCPYLGLEFDAATRSLCPDLEHCCYRSGPTSKAAANKLTVEYQLRYCLGSGYQGCEIFQQTPGSNKRGGVFARVLPAWYLASAIALVVIIVAVVAIVATGNFSEWLGTPLHAGSEPASVSDPAPDAETGVVGTPTDPTTVIVGDLVIATVSASDPMPTKAPMSASTPMVNPTGTATSVPADGTLPATANDVPTNTVEIHIVAPGETLSGIANYYGVSIDAVAKANELDDIRVVYSGQKLIIPSE